MTIPMDVVNSQVASDLRKEGYALYFPESGSRAWIVARKNRVFNKDTGFEEGAKIFVYIPNYRTGLDPYHDAPDLANTIHRALDDMYKSGAE